MNKYKDWAGRESSLNRRLILLGFAGVFFLLLLPYLLFLGGRGLDRGLGLARLEVGALNWIIGGLLIAAGFFFALWSISVQVTTGRGTPVPAMPTVKLIVQPPFSYCRNPMTLGTFIGYLGIAVVIGSISMIGLVCILTLLLLSYIKFIEEKELALRFGPDYLEYKRTTPFILPRFRRRA